jgi:hypothetical protein
MIPVPPTSGVNGQVVSSPALHSSMSMLSLTPAASTSGRLASTATAGSFCLLREKKLSLLPTVTSRSPPWTARAGGGAANAEQTNTPRVAIDRGIRRVRTRLIRAPPPSRI